jgi:predicted nucleotidyltransferase
MADGEIIEKITSIDEQIHDLRKMVLESGSRIKEDEAKSAAKAWLDEAKKLEKRWPKTAPPVLEMTKKDRRHDE